MKIRQLGAELFHAARETDGSTGRHDEANNRYSKFWNAPGKKRLFT